MATYNPRNRQVRFSRDGKRFFLVLPPGTKTADGEAARQHVEHLIYVRDNNHPPHQSTLEWLAGLRKHQHDKLSRAGLVESRVETECKWVEGFVSWILDRKRDLGAKQTSITAYEQPAANLRSQFAGRLLRSINEVDVWEFRKWLANNGNRRTGGGLSDTTVRKRLKVCREWFELALDHHWIERNPFRIFRDLDQRTQGERQHYVPGETVDRLIAEAPAAEWRILLSLWRYAGLRATEPLLLRWSDVDFAGSRISVTCCKTGRIRIIPLWPEVQKHLAEQFDAAPEGAEWVIYDAATRGTFDTRPESRATSTRLYNRLQRQLSRLKIWPWPKLLQNLRASGETQRVVEGWPAHVIAAWWGHSERIQQKHYLQVPDDMYDRAIQTQGANNDGLPTTNPTQSAPTRSMVSICLKQCCGVRLSRMQETTLTK